MRVLPQENEAINECWLSDKDRFSYEGLNSAERLTQPMLKQGGVWRETDWETALQYVVNGLKKISADHGAAAIGALVSPHSTLEELFLFKQLAAGVGTPNVDFRLRQSDFSASAAGAPWLGMPIADLSALDAAFVIGSFLRRDHPLLAARLRVAAKGGAKIIMLGATKDDALIPSAQRLAAAPSAWLVELAAIAAAVADARSVALPSAFAGVAPADAHRQIAAKLIAGEQRAVLLGNSAVAHPAFAQLHAAAAWIAEQTGAKLGFLTEAANTVGAHLAGAVPATGGLNAAEMFEQPRKAYLLFNVEAQFDTANPAQAVAALQQAQMVVSFASFKHSAELADVLLPIAPFTETAGAFVNCEGRLQAFNGVVRPLGETRPGWKVLRVLGNLLGLPGFNYDTAEEVRSAALGSGEISARLSNAATAALVAVTHTAAADGAFERIADVPIYQADAIVRRADSLQLTRAAKQSVQAFLPAGVFDRLALKDGDAVVVRQGAYSVQMPAVRDLNLPEGVVRVPAATSASAALGAMFGELLVEKA
jgi:NADH-quinone oxidoreductase subunit G